MNSSIEFSTLLASSVHDIKNSVGLLLNSLEEVIADMPPETNEEKRRFTILKSETSRINNALISLLGLYRLEHKQMQVNVDEVMVLNFLEEQVAAQQLLFDINNIDVAIECAYDLTGFFDQQLVSGIISNVLVNGAKFTKDRLCLRASYQQPWLLIEVIDNGDGYPPALLDEISHTERGIDFKSGSTSLGLFFAREIARMHHNRGFSGDISLHNIPEGGGCFQLRLP